MHHAYLTCVDDVIVHFIDEVPSDEVVRCARQCVRERGLDGPLRVTIAKTLQQRHRVSVEGSGRRCRIDAKNDADIVAAMRDAFERFAASLRRSVGS
jgi:hypothetical protein